MGFRRGGGCPVRLLHSRHGDGGEGAAGCEPRPHRGGDRLCPAYQHLPLHRLCEDHRRGEAGGQGAAGGEDSPAGWGELALRPVGPPAGCAGEGAGLRQVSRRRLFGRHDLRLRRPQRLSPGHRQSHPHRCGQSPARRGGGFHRRRYPRQEQGGPYQQGLGHHDRRGGHDPLPGRRHRHRGGRVHGDRGGRQEAGGGGLRAPDSGPQPLRGHGRGPPLGPSPGAST